MVNVLVLDIETSGLHPASCFISCVGVFSPVFGIRVFGGSEEALLRDFLEFLEARCSASEFELVTFNGLVFDLPFIEARCKALSLEGGGVLRDFTHFDLMSPARVRISEGKRWVSKGEVCNKLDVYCPKCADGFFCAELAKQGSGSKDFFKVFQHNALDLVETFELFNKMRFLRWV